MTRTKNTQKNVDDLWKFIFQQTQPKNIMYENQLKSVNSRPTNDRWVNKCRELWSVNKFYINPEYYLIAHTWYSSVCQKYYSEICFYFWIENKTK